MQRELRRYVEENILPLYDGFDGSHNRIHVQNVIRKSLAIAEDYDVDVDMVYAIAAYHDSGLNEGRETHHITSGARLAGDETLAQWFTPAQIAIMREAVEDHRASAESAPRSIYGRIVADADRELDLKRLVGRTLAYGASHFPQLTDAEQDERAYDHVRDKFGPEGYMRLWLPDAATNARLRQEINGLLADKDAFFRLCAAIRAKK